MIRLGTKNSNVKIDFPYFTMYNVYTYCVHNILLFSYYYIYYLIKFPALDVKFLKKSNFEKRLFLKKNYFEFFSLCYH